MLNSAEAITFSKRVKKKERVVRAPELSRPLCDTHAHLRSFWEKQPVESLQRAYRAGVERLVTLIDPVGDEMNIPVYQEWLRGEVLSAPEIPQLKYLAGVHPYGAAGYTDEIHAQIEAALADPYCAGIGEIGLDYHFDSDDEIAPAAHDVQIAAFERQLGLACERNVPVELHLRHDAADEERTSHTDAYEVLRRVGLPQAGCVLHCFGEDLATMERFVELGCYIAYGGAATFKRNEEVREAFAATPLERILFETDCPYMAPEPIRGLECEPAMMTLTAQALSCDRCDRTGEAPDEILAAAWENAAQLFFA